MTNRDTNVEFGSVFAMRRGPQRRAMLLHYIRLFMQEYNGLPVNNKWQWSTNDPDVKYLLKKGFLKRHRVATPPGRNQNTGMKRGGKGQTYLIIT